LRIECDPADVEVISDVLWSHGAAAVEELPGTRGRSVLRTHLADAAVIEDLRGRFHGISVGVDEVPTRVSETWRAHAVPAHVVDDLWLVPAWCAPPAGAKAVMVEPGATFGLGDHPTTVLALRRVLAVCAEGARVHDHGTGSGVLAVALSAWRGAEMSADDIAPESRAVVAANARLNSVDVPTWTEGLPTGVSSFDGIVANILAPVLREDAPRLEALVRPGGWIVLSGLRADQVDSVTSRYATSDVETVEEKDGWVAVVLRRRE